MANCDYSQQLLNLYQNGKLNYEKDELKAIRSYKNNGIITKINKCINNTHCRTLYNHKASLCNNDLTIYLLSLMLHNFK